MQQPPLLIPAIQKLLPFDSLAEGISEGEADKVVAGVLDAMRKEGLLKNNYTPKVWLGEDASRALTSRGVPEARHGPMAELAAEQRRGGPPEIFFPSHARLPALAALHRLFRSGPYKNYLGDLGTPSRLQEDAHKKLLRSFITTLTHEIGHTQDTRPRDLASGPYKHYNNPRPYSEDSNAYERANREAFADEFGLNALAKLKLEDARPSDLIASREERAYSLDKAKVLDSGAYRNRRQITKEFALRDLAARRLDRGRGPKPPTPPPIKPDRPRSLTTQLLFDFIKKSRG